MRANVVKIKKRWGIWWVTHCGWEVCASFSLKHAHAAAVSYSLTPLFVARSLLPR